MNLAHKSLRQVCDWKHMCALSVVVDVNNVVRPRCRMQTPSKGFSARRSPRSNTANRSSPASESGEEQVARQRVGVWLRLWLQICRCFSGTNGRLRQNVCQPSRWPFSTRATRKAFSPVHHRQHHQQRRWTLHCLVGYSRSWLSPPTLRFRSLRWRRVRGGEHDFQHGHEQSHLPAVRGCSRCQEQPGSAHLWALPAAALQEGLPWLLPADRSANMPAPDQVRVKCLPGDKALSSKHLLCCNTVTTRYAVQLHHISPGAS